MPRTDDVAAIADAVVALHSTDPVTVYLSAMLRMAHPSVEAVEQALYVDRARRAAPRDAPHAVGGHARTSYA